MNIFWQIKMKVGIARIYTKNNDFNYNIESIKKLYNTAENSNIDLLIFPKLAITGFAIDETYLTNEYIENYDNELIENIVEMTVKKHCKILIGDIYSREIESETDIKYKKELLDSAFFIDNGTVNTVLTHKFFSKNNPLNEIKYFDRSSFISNFKFEKKQFTVLLGDDIYHNINIILTSDQKPNYVICLDSSNVDIKQKQQQLIKIAKFSNCPVLYLNSATYINRDLFFSGEIILINEEFKLEYFDMYRDNEIFEFFLDYEDGSELFIQNKNQLTHNLNNVFILKKEFENKNLNIICEFYTQNQLDNIKTNIDNVKFYKFDDDNNNYQNITVDLIKIEDYINKDFYLKLNKQQQKQLKELIIWNQ